MRRSDHQALFGQTIFRPNQRIWPDAQFDGDDQRRNRRADDQFGHRSGRDANEEIGARQDHSHQTGQGIQRGRMGARSSAALFHKLVRKS